VSDGAAADMDPRFDPRFQRGYSGDGAIPTDAAATPLPQAATPLPAAPRVPDPPTAAPDAIAPTQRIAAMPSRPAADVVPGAGELVAPLGDHGAVLEDDATTGEPTTRTWLIAGWVVTAAAFGLGLWWSWSVHSDIGLYTGGMTSGDQVFRELGWALSPALLTGGAIGAVVVTGAAVMLQPSREPKSSEQAEAAAAGGHARRRRRSAAWWAMLAILAASVLMSVWLANRMIEGAAVSSGLVLDANGDAVIDQSAQLTAMAFGQFAQSVLGPMATAAIVAFVALVVIEARRASFSAARAR